MFSQNFSDRVTHFYANCDYLSTRYMETADERDEYLRDRPCEVMAAVCMDERERDFGETMGLPFGMPQLIETAGNKLGQINPRIHNLITAAIEKAASKRRRVLLFFVTHSSVGKPDSDSCAAWSHNINDAQLDAKRQVWQFNHAYGDNPVFGINRPLIAMHLHSYTDTEARCWIAGDDTLDPSIIHVGRFSELTDDQFRAKATELGHDQLSLMFRSQLVNPSLSDNMVNTILRQCAEMFATNALVVRDVLSGKRVASKGGHQGRRVLIGDWPLHTQAGEYFKIGDYVPDMGTELGIAFKYVLRNEIVQAAGDIDYRPIVPIHINVEYGESMGRNEAMHRSEMLVHLVNNELEDLLCNPYRRSHFVAAVTHALEVIGIEDRFDSLSHLFKDNPLSTFKVLPSVSDAQTKRIIKKVWG